MTTAKEIYGLFRYDLLVPVLQKLRTVIADSDYAMVQQYEDLRMLCGQYYQYPDAEMFGNIRQRVLLFADEVLSHLENEDLRVIKQITSQKTDAGEQTLNQMIASIPVVIPEIDQKMDEQFVALFNQIVGAQKLSAENIQNLSGLMSDEADKFVRYLVTYALMLRCLRCFDLRIIQMLMTGPDAESFAALAMISLECCGRISIDSQAVALYENFLSDQENADRFEKVLMNIARTYETKMVANELRNKIIPEVMKRSEKFRSEKGMFTDGEMSLDWEQELEESGLLDKMRKINDLQMSGTDVHFESFQNMKFAPFFFVPAHWFYAFDRRYFAMKGMKIDNKVAKVLPLHNLCDSDCYSLVFMFSQLGMSNMEDALKTMGLKDLDGASEQLDDREDWQGGGKPSFESEVRFAVMNLFRFYDHFASKGSKSLIYDFFGRTELQYFSEFATTPQLCYKLADILFHAQAWKRALYFYNLSDATETDDVHFYQKTGYCYQKINDLASAIEEYNKADIVNPDDQWTLRHLAYCYKMKGDLTNSVSVYKRLLEMTPDSEEVLYNLAMIYLDRKIYKEAKPLLYKLDYQYSKPHYAVLLGTCLGAMGDKKAAYDNITKGAETAEDHLLAAKYAPSPVETETSLRHAREMTGDDNAFLEMLGKVEYEEDMTNIINKILLL